MELARKLSLLADAAKYDASCASGGSKKTRPGKGLGSTEKMGICHSFTPDGRCVSLLKVLLTNFCIFDCQYCVNRISSGVPRARFKVDELVNLTLDFYRRNYIEGLFLSSGIIRNSDYTMEQLIQVAKKLRVQEQFRGYIHLKSIPGADPRLIQEAGLYADRLSINIELPTEHDLQQLAPQKKRAVLEHNMQTIAQQAEEIQQDRSRGLATPSFAPAGQSTQIIVGATPSSDQQILTTAASLYKKYQLRRVYYSAFSPIPHADARLPSISPPLLREHRLYQADWLLRFYNFQLEEIVPATEPNLVIEHDPKTTWALRNPDYFPLDINRAAREQLLRIPGIGVRSVESILTIRRYRKLRLADLIQLRIAFNRAKYFLITADYHPPQLRTNTENSLKQLTFPL